MFFISQSSNFAILLLLTVVMGGAAGGAHISMTTLPMAWFDKNRLGRALGIVTGGTGLGIIVTGLLLPVLLSSLGKGAWRQCWVFLSVMTLAVAMMGWILLKEKPVTIPVPPAIPEKNIVTPQATPEFTLKTLFVHYFVFGFAYNIYATYFVAFMVDEVHLSGKLAGLIWSLFGWTCLASGLVWGSLSDRLGRKTALLWNNLLISLALLIPLLFHHPLLLGTSSFLFGFTFLGTITIVAASVGDLTVEKKASVYGLITLVHGIGQFLGTTSGGYLKDLTGSFHATLLSSLLGFVLCCVLILTKTKVGGWNAQSHWK
jgi:MFS family permease